MPHDVIMPQMGESIAEGTITTWLKKEGEQVARDEPLFEMSTDKVDAEIPSPVAGTLIEIKVKPGETVPINTVVAVIGDGAEARAGGNGAAAPKAESKREPKPAPKAEAPAREPSRPQRAERPAPSAEARPASVEERRRTKSSPVVRKIASKHGVDITEIPGTGISGRVTKKDILAHLEGGQPRAEARPAERALEVRAPSRAPDEIPAAYRAKVFEGDRVEDMSKMRALIADHMVLSRRVSAHVQTVWEVDFTRVAALRSKHKDTWREQHDVNLTYTSFIMKATVDALKAFPVVNASVDDHRVIYHRDVNLGVAVALDWGLIVPVIRGANELNLLGLTRRLNDLGTRAREKRLKPDEVQDGTFTITNPGVFGNLFGLPVINQPQVAILGAGGVEKRPVVIDDAIAIRTRAYISLSFDHRLVDGAIADQFMARVKEGVEQFDESEL